MDDRELSFSKSEDEQSEMSNHEYEQDIKPVIKFFLLINVRIVLNPLSTSL